MEWPHWFRVSVAVIAVAAAFYLASVLWVVVGFFADIVLILFFAWVISAGMRRVVGKLERTLRLSHGTAVAVAYLGLLVILAGLIAPLVVITVAQAVQFAQAIPSYAKDTPAILRWVQGVADDLGLNVDVLAVYQPETLVTIGNAFAAFVVRNAVSIAQGTVLTLFQTILVIILSIYILLDGNRLADFSFHVVPTRFHADFRDIVERMDTTFFLYVRGILVISAIYGTLVLTIMLIMALPFALPVTLAAAFLVIIPFIGNLLALGIPLLIAYFVLPPGHALILTGIVALASVMIENLISPRVLGGAVKMPALLVMVSVLAGAKVAGPWGVVLAIPMAAMAYATTIAWVDRARARRAMAIQDPVPAGTEASTGLMGYAREGPHLTPHAPDPPR